MSDLLERHAGGREQRPSPWCRAFDSHPVGAAIGVPSAYFGRGLCLIVYVSHMLSAVLTNRPI